MTCGVIGQSTQEKDIQQMAQFQRMVMEDKARYQRDLAEAILWHGGEGRTAREAFRKAPLEERSALLSFLQSL